MERYGEKALYGGGLSVRTTLDPRLQDIARRSLRAGLIAYDRRHGWRGAFEQIPLDEQWQARLAAIKAPDGLGDWRLAVVRITVPALRDRIEDLPEIVAALAPQLEAECGRGPLRLTEGAMQRLATHRWPGNLRELRGVLARALLDAARLPLEERAIRLDTSSGTETAEATGLEEHMIRGALASSGGHIGRAAGRIGWTRQKLYRRMAALGIRRNQTTRRDLDSTTSSASSTFQ